MLGAADGRLVVLDHEHRVPVGAEAVEGVEEEGVVARVEPDGGLVEHVAHPAQVRAELRREPDPLGFPAAQGRGGPVEGEIAEADLEQEIEPRAELGEEVAGHLLVPPVEIEVLHPAARLRDREPADLPERPLPEAHRPRLGPQPVAAAVAAYRRRSGRDAFRNLLALVLGHRAGLARGAVPSAGAAPPAGAAPGRGPVRRRWRRRKTGSPAAWAPAVARIEGEESRVELVEAPPAPRAGARRRIAAFEALRECALRVFAGPLGHDHRRPAELQGGVEGGAKGPLAGGIDGEDRDREVDVVLAVAVEARPLAGRQVLAVHPQVRVALARRPAGEVRVVPLAADDEGCKQLHRAAPELPHHARQHRVAGLRLDGPLAVGTVLDPELREQQAQEVVDLGGGRDGALGPSAARALLDGDGRRDPEDRVHVGAGGRLHELPRVGVERLEVAALSFREHDVEREGALSAPADPGDRGEPVARQPDVDVLEVVVAGAADLDRLGGGVGGGRRFANLRAAAVAGTNAGAGSSADPRMVARGIAARIRSRFALATLRGALLRVLPALPLRKVGAELASGVAPRVGGDRRGRPLADDLATAVAALGSEVDDPVRGPDHVEVMLDDHHRVSGRDELPERGEEGRHVVEVQPGGGLVEEEQGTAAPAFPRPDAAGRADPAERPRKVPRELEALRLAAAQGRHRLAEGDVAEPHRGEGRELLPDVGRIGEAGDGLIDGEVEHVGDGKTVRGDLHFQDVRPEAPPVAVRTAQVHVAQELHLEVLEAVPRAGGASSVRVVEAEPSGGIAAFPGERLGREELADRVEGADVARRDRAAGLADRGLVHQHHVRDRLHPFDPVVESRGLPRAAETLEEPAVAHLLDQGRLPRAAHPGDADELAERDPDVDPLEVVLRRAADQEVGAVGVGRAGFVPDPAGGGGGAGGRGGSPRTR